MMQKNSQISLGIEKVLQLHHLFPSGLYRRYWIYTSSCLRSRTITADQESHLPQRLTLRIQV